MLKRLSSLTGLFQEAFEFHPGINLIVGKYSARREPDSSGGVNGIGKSSLIRLIEPPRILRRLFSLRGLIEP